MKSSMFIFRVHFKPHLIGCQHLLSAGSKAWLALLCPFRADYVITDKPPEERQRQVQLSRRPSKRGYEAGVGSEVPWEGTAQKAEEGWCQLTQLLSSSVSQGSPLHQSMVWSSCLPCPPPPIPPTCLTLPCE